VRLRRLIHGRVDPVVHQQLKAEAAARQISMTACVGDLLREYFALQEEMARGRATSGQPGDRHRGLIHSFLARSEERLAAKLEACTSQLGGRLQKLEVMLDHLVFVYLVHTLDVPHHLQHGAIASANWRHGQYRKSVADRLARGSRGAGSRGDSQESHDGQGKDLGPSPGAPEPGPDSSEGLESRGAPS